MKVADQTSGRIAYIDIPLSFGAEIPDVTIPGKARPPSMPAIRSPGGPTTPKKQ
jgi:hypothetical protein